MWIYPRLKETMLIYRSVFYGFLGGKPAFECSDHLSEKYQKLNLRLFTVQMPQLPTWILPLRQGAAWAFEMMPRQNIITGKTTTSPLINLVLALTVQKKDFNETLGLNANKDASMLAEQGWEKNHSIKILARCSFEEIMTEGSSFITLFWLKLRAWPCALQQRMHFESQTHRQH